MNNFLPVDHPKFKQLSFKDQVRIVSLSIYDQDSYKETCKQLGFKVKESKEPETYKYINSSIDFINEVKANESPKIDKNFKVNIVQHWAAYKCTYNKKYKDLDIGNFNIDHKFAININIFNFPLLILDSYAHLVYSWVQDKYPNLDNPSSFVLFLQILVKCLEREYTVEDLYNSKLKRVNGRVLYKAYKNIDNVRSLRSIRKINNYMKITSGEKYFNEILQYYDRSLICPRYVVYRNYSVDNNLNYYYPVIPEIFYLRDERFTIIDWSLLI